MCRARDTPLPRSTLCSCVARDSHISGTGIRRPRPAEGPQVPAAKTRPLPEGPRLETSANPGPSEWPVAGSEEWETSPRPPCWEGSVDTTPSRVFRDDTRQLVLSPGYPLLSGPAGGTGSGSSGGWKDRDADHLRRQLSERGGAAGMRKGPLLPRAGPSQCAL